MEKEKSDSFKSSHSGGKPSPPIPEEDDSIELKSSRAVSRHQKEVESRLYANASQTPSRRAKAASMNEHAPASKVEKEKAKSMSSPNESFSSVEQTRRRFEEMNAYNEAQRRKEVERLEKEQKDKNRFTGGFDADYMRTLEVPLIMDSPSDREIELTKSVVLQEHAELDRLRKKEVLQQKQQRARQKGKATRLEFVRTRNTNNAPTGNFVDLNVNVNEAPAASEAPKAKTPASAPSSEYFFRATPSSAGDRSSMGASGDGSFSSSVSSRFSSSSGTSKTPSSSFRSSAEYPTQPAAAWTSFTPSSSASVGESNGSNEGPELRGGWIEVRALTAL